MKKVPPDLYLIFFSNEKVGTGKKVRVAVFVKDDQKNLALEAGADLAGNEDLSQSIQEGKIDFAGNGRYFILNPDKKKPKPKKTSAPKSESTDIPEQIKKLSDLKDQGILTEEEFQSKKKDLLDKM